jgi:protein-tyrosine phosphatase
VNFDFITENIAVGQKIDSQVFADALAAAGITHVLNLFSGNQETFWTGAVCYVPQEDDGSPRTHAQIARAISYAFESLRDGGKLYIHCQWGLGRAPSTCYAILRRLGFTREEAIARICAKRPRCAAWNWQQYISSIEEALR